MIKAVIFDLDGTVVESTNCDFHAWQKLFSDLGTGFSFDDYKGISGKKTAEILKGKIKDIKEQDVDKFSIIRTGYFKECVEKNSLKPANGLIDFLNSLTENGYKVAIQTGASRRRVSFMLKAANVERHFSIVVTADDVSFGKPNPETVLTAARKLGCKPEECLVIEDAPLGIAAAKNAGMKCIAITTTHSAGELKEADKIIRSFDELSAEKLRNFFD